MKAIEIISVPVTDQEAAKQFYMDKLGFALIIEAPFGEGQKWIQLGIPGSEVTITLVTWFPQMPAGSLQAVVIKTDDIAADVQTLTDRGVQVGKTDITPWGKFASFKDPDGNGWTLHE